MANAGAFINSTSVSTLPESDTEKSNLRPTSKDYASEIQRLEMESQRMKLQSQPLLTHQQAIAKNIKNATASTVQATSSRSDETLQYSTSKKMELQSQNVSHTVQQPLASRSIPEIRFNLDSIKAEMQRNKQVVNSIQHQLSNRPEELNGVRSQLLKEKRDTVLLGHQRDLFSGDASQEQRMMAELRMQLDHQARENAILKQLQLQQEPGHVLSSTTSESTRPSNEDKTSPFATHQNAVTLAASSVLKTSAVTTVSSTPLQMHPSDLSTAQATSALPPTTETLTLPSPTASLSHSVQSSGGISPSSVSPHSSFTSVTSTWSSAMPSARSVESTKEVQVLPASSIGPPANVDGQRRTPADKSNEIHLQKRLDQSQTQITRLKDRLKECQDSGDQQKIHFRESLQEFQTKLTETIVGRDSVLQLRRKEAEERERLIEELKGTLTELDADYKTQQKVMRESNLQMESFQQTLTNTSTVLNQINLLVTKEAEVRGLNLIVTATSTHHSGLTNQRPALALTSLKQLLKCCDDETQDARQRAMNSGKELEDLRKEFGEYKLKTSEEHRSKLNQLSEDHETQLNTATERALNARQQATGLQEQLTILQDQIQQQMAGKNAHISDLEQTLVDMQTQMKENRNVLEEKCKSLNNELDELTEHSRAVTNERNDLVTIVESLEMELAETKDSVGKAEMDAEAKHDQNRRLEEMSKETANKCNDLLNQLREKTSEVQGVKELMVKAKEDAERQAMEQITEAVMEERQRSSELTSQLSTQVASLTQKCTVLSHELDQKETLLYTFKKQQDDTLRTTEDRDSKLQIALSEKAELENTMEDMKKEAEVVKQERDHYFGLADQRNKEVSSLRCQEEKLLAQVSQLEHHTTALREQSTTMAHLVEMNTKSSNEMKEEKASLQQLLEERITEVERSKVTMEEMERRLKMKERKVEEVEEENVRLTEEVEAKMKDMEDIIESKEKMLTELREAKMEVDTIAKNNERLRLDAVQSRRQFDKERNRLASKLRTVEHELTVTTKAIQTTGSMDVKAVRVAENMQKKVTAKRGQIDSLQSKINWLDECLDAAFKEKSAVISEKDMLVLKVERLTKHNQRLTAEHGGMVQKRKAQKSVIRKLETAIERAALKHSEMQANVEMQQQDKARLRLKHQLEIKELQRSSAVPNVSRTSIITATKPAHTITTTPSITPTLGTKVTSTQTNDNIIDGGMSVEKQCADKDVFISQPIIQESSPTTRASADIINDELKALLSEMKSVLHTATSDASSRYNNLPRLLHAGNVRMLHDTQTYSKGLDPPIHASSPYKDTTTTPPSTPPRYDTPLSDAHHHQLGPLTGYTSNEMTLDGPPSPVANLLGSYDNREQPGGGGGWSITPGRVSMESRVTDVPARDRASEYQTKTRRRAGSGADIQIAEVTESQDNISGTDLNDSMQKQCQHIEEMEQQLKALAKIGGQLQYENKEMATLIKSQNVKLKRCRKEEEECVKTMQVSSTPKR